MEQMLTCSLCLEIFADPQTFPCFHSFCQACIQKLPVEDATANITNTAVNPLCGYLCPLCRAFAREEDVRANFLVNELLHMFRASCKQTAVCLQCAEGVDSQWKCADCLIELCEKCHLSHLRIPVCRGHRVVPLDSHTEGVIDRLVFCTVHSDQPVMLNCADCECPLCIKCKVTEHEAHRTETVERAVERLRPVLEGQRGRIGKRLEELESELKDTTKVVEDTRETFTYCRESIEEKRQALITRINNEAQGQLDTLERRQDVELGKLREKSSQVENKIKEYCMLQDWIGTTLEKTRGAILLVECQSGLQQKVERLLEQTGKGSAITIDRPTYLANPAAGKAQQGLMGRIEYNQVSVSSILPDLSAATQSALTDCTNATTTPSSTQPPTCLHGSNKTVHHTNFETLFQKDWKCSTTSEIKVTEGHCAKVRFVRGELWLPLFNQHAILVYSLGGHEDDAVKFLRRVVHVSIRHPIAVDAEGTTVVMVASESGLFAITAQGEMFATVTTGAAFSDVCVVNGRMAALEYSRSQSSRCQVHLYFKKEVKDKEGVNNKDQHGWEQERTFCFGVPSIDKFSALLLGEDTVWVCPSNSHKIYSHRLEGNIMDRVMETTEKKQPNMQDHQTASSAAIIANSSFAAPVEISLHTGNSLRPEQHELISEESRPVLNLTQSNSSTNPCGGAERKVNKASSLPTESGGTRDRGHDQGKPPIYPMKSPHTPQPQRRAKAISLPENPSGLRVAEQGRGLVISTEKATGSLNTTTTGEDRNNVLAILSEYGSQGHQGVGRVYFPMLCGLDAEGCLLVADCHNRRLQLLKKNGQWEVVGKPGHGNDTLEDVVVVSENELWVLQNWNRLVKYTCT